MKKLFLILLTIGMLGTQYSCREQGNNFQLTGHIQGLEDTIVKLYGIFSIPDTIMEIPVKEGKFSCKIPMDTITPLFLQLDSGKREYPIFANKKTSIHIEGEAKALQNLRITGNPIQEEYNSFYNSITPKHNYFDIIQKADSFIINHPHSIVSIYLIYKYFVNAPDPKVEVVKSTVEQLSGNMQDHPYISRLMRNFDENKRSSSSTQYLHITNIPDSIGHEFKSSDHKNNYLVVSLWASWHQESVAMQDSLQSIIKAFAKRPVKFINISLDNDREAWLNTIRDNKWKGIHLCDQKGWNNPLIKDRAITDLPHIIILNSSNKIMASQMWGQKLENFLNKQLDTWESQQKKQKKKLQKRSRR